MAKRRAKSPRKEAPETELAKRIAKVVGKTIPPRNDAEREVASALGDVIVAEMLAGVSRGAISTRIGADAAQKFRAGFKKNIDDLGMTAPYYWSIERPKVLRMLELTGGLADIRARTLGESEIDWPNLRKSLLAVKENTYGKAFVTGRWCRFLGS